MTMAPRVPVTDAAQSAAAAPPPPLTDEDGSAPVVRPHRVSSS